YFTLHTHTVKYLSLHFLHSTSSLHYCFTATVHSHSALYIFLKLLRPLHCCTVCFVLCKHIESHFTSPSQIPCLCKLTWPIKPDSDSNSDCTSPHNSLNSFPLAGVCGSIAVHTYR